MIEFDSLRRHRRRAVVRYLMAALSVTAALILTWGLKQLFPATPNALYFCAIILSAWLGGFGPGILASVLASAAVHFTPPASSPVEIPRFVLFLLVGVFASWLIARQRRTQAALQQARDQFEQQVNERTKELTAANKGLRESENQLRLVIDTIPTMAWIVLPDGAIDFINLRWREYTGLSLEAALNEPMRTIHPDDLPRVKEKWSVNLVSREPYEDEMRLRRADGEYRWFLIRTVPLCDEQGNLIRWYGTSTDIEDRKRAEAALQETQTALARVARITIVGELTASIAHEVNQPLAGVVNNANAGLRWLAAAPPNLGEACEALRRIARDGNRAGDVITRIRALLRKGEPARTPLSINEVIQETVALAHPELTRVKVSLQTELAADLPQVPADRVQLQQVLLNLVVNALDSLSAVADRPRLLRIRTDRHEQHAVRVAVQDTGIGVAPGQSERLFQAFFTTKPHGLGMGLAISRSIIEAHGGRLWMTPNGGPGVTFQFALPVQNGDAT